MSFFHDSHVSGESGAQDNKLTTEASDPDNPTATEFQTALRATLGTLMAFKDERGDPMSLSATGLVIVVPTTMYISALEAVNSTVISSTSNVLEGVARIIALPWLSDASKWYLLKTDGVLRPFIFQDREPVEFTALTEDSDEGFRREKFLYGVRARYRMTYGYWQYAVRLNFTGQA